MKPNHSLQPTSVSLLRSSPVADELNRSATMDIRMRMLPVLVLVLLAIPAIEAFAEDYWVTSDRLERRTCPSFSCGIVGQLFYREKVAVLETNDEWARVTPFYDAACVDGRSEYVDSGRNDCSEENGIINGQFAEWVQRTTLSKVRPADPAAGAAADAALIAGSDDYRLHKAAFLKATRLLIDRGMCTTDDFKKFGGWVKSTMYREQPIYFVYCGGMTLSNKVHLDVSSGRTFK